MARARPADQWLLDIAIFFGASLSLGLDETGVPGAGGDIKQLSLGPVRFGARGPSMLWGSTPESRAATHSTARFSMVRPEADRIRWLNGFRRLIDELDSPMQVVIQTEPGSGGETIRPRTSAPRLRRG